MHLFIYLYLSHFESSIVFSSHRRHGSPRCCLVAAQVEVNRCSRVQCVVEQAASSVYMDSRSVTLRGTLAAGRYVVLPTTFLPGVTGRFLLRLFCHSHVRLRSVTDV